MIEPTLAMPYRPDRDAVFATYAGAVRFAAAVATPTNRVRVRHSRRHLDGFLFRTYYARGAWIVCPGSPVPWRDMRKEWQS